jgi:hypothetical protein
VTVTVQYPFTFVVPYFGTAPAMTQTTQALFN